MTGIFVSYRRVDSRVYAGRLFDRLSSHFGRDLVFMDVEGGIARGDDFTKTIDAAIDSVAAIVVVIGSQWLACTDSRGARRLDNADDWVRGEIVAALKRGILVLPVLVDGASMPKAEQLPEEIRLLSRRHASEITDSRWDFDVGEIIKALERVVPPGPLSESAKRTATSRAVLFKRLRQWLGWAGSAAVTAVIALSTWDVLFAPKPEDYAFTVEPPQVRIRQDASTVQTVALQLTNTGTRPAPFHVRANFFTSSPSTGALAIRDDTCGTRSVPTGQTCTINIVFDPKWLTGDDAQRSFNGELQITAFGNGRSIPLMIEVPVAPAVTVGTVDAHQRGTRMEVTLANQKRLILLAGDITTTKADVLVRFTDNRGNARDPLVDADIRRYAGPSFESEFRQGLASPFLGGRLEPGSSVLSTPVKGPVPGQAVCSTYAPAEDTADPDLPERLARAYQGCFGLAITGPALSVAFPATNRIKGAEPTVIGSLVADLLKESRLRRVFLVMPPKEPDTFRAYSEALTARLQLKTDASSKQ